MNGDSKTIYEAIINVNEKITSIKVDVAEIKTSQELHHKQNQEDIKEYKETSKCCIKLKTQVFYQWFFITAIFLGIIAIFFRSLNGS